MKIVFFDIDGTLLDHEKKLPASTKEALRKLRENGVYVAISTGRAPFMFEFLRKELEIDSYVSFNGQFVVFENEVIYRNPLSSAQLKQLHKDALQQEGGPVSIVFMNEQTMKSSTKHDPRIDEALASLNFPHPEHDEHFYEDKEIYQSLFFCTEAEEQLYVNNYQDIKFIRWHPFSTDVVPKNGSKAEGIKKFLERKNFKNEDVYAFGDGLNDIEMLKMVGHGIAMGNALDEVQKEADYITKSVDEDGIYHGLKHFGLI